MMPPPTQIMAAVPTALSKVSSPACHEQRAAERAATESRSRSLPRQRHADIVGLHDQRHDAVHGHRDGDPTTASTIACIQSPPGGRERDRHDLAERMKSVLIALAIFSSSSDLRVQRRGADARFMLVRIMRQTASSTFSAPS